MKDNKRVADVGTRARMLVEWMTQGIYEKEQIAAMALLCAVAGENIFLLGPPGTAKSMVARRLKGVFRDARVFEYLMSRFSTPDELFGPISISRLKDSDSYERLTEGFLPEADVVFLDEIWKAGPSIQNTLLTAINEHIYYNGRRRLSLPMKVLIAAGNELPPKNEGLEALWDRFLIRMVSNCITDDDNFERMLTDVSETADRAPEDLALDAEVYEEWRAMSRVTVVDKSAIDAVKSIRHALGRLALTDDNTLNPDYYISDRRWKKCYRLLQASAFLNGRPQVDGSDLVLLVHCLWSRPDCRSEVNRVVTESLWHDVTTTVADIDLKLRAIVNPAEDKSRPAASTQFVADEELTLFYNSYYAVEDFDGTTSLIPKWDYRKLSYMEITPGQVSLDHSLRMPVVQIQNRNTAFSTGPDSGRPRKLTLQKCNGGVMIDGIPYSLARRGAQPVSRKKVTSTCAADVESLATRLDDLSQQWNRRKPALLKAIETNIFLSATDKATVATAMDEVDRTIAETRIKTGNVRHIIS